MESSSLVLRKPLQLNCRMEELDGRLGGAGEGERVGAVVGRGVGVRR